MKYHSIGLLIATLIAFSVTYAFSAGAGNVFGSAALEWGVKFSRMARVMCRFCDVVARTIISSTLALLTGHSPYICEGVRYA